MKTSLHYLAILATVSTLAACSNTHQPQTSTPTPTQAQTLPSHINAYEQLMLNKVWVTTAAIDQNKKAVPASDARVKDFFGFAQYGANGQFIMYTPNKQPKLQGDWSFSEDGKQRHLIAKDASGKELFRRTVDNVTVNANEYTYRIYPNANNRRQYIDIVHQVAR